MSSTDAEGYHDRRFSGIAYGIVFLELSKKLRDEWTVTLSHEALELTADPADNLLVRDRIPQNLDAKCSTGSKCAMSSRRRRYDRPRRREQFCTPALFHQWRRTRGRNDFLGTITKGGKTLRSFSVNPGGYIGFLDSPENGHTTWSLDDDPKGKRRLATKGMLKNGRGHLRRGDLRQALD